MKTIQDKVNYPKVYITKVYGVNEALRDRLIEYLHNKDKHDAEYKKSKQVKRIYQDKLNYEKNLKWK